jgi:hypothetical protein
MIPIFGVNSQTSQLPLYAAMQGMGQPYSPMLNNAMAQSSTKTSPAMGSSSGPPEISGSNVFRGLKIAFDALVLGGITSFIFRVNSKISMIGNMTTSIVEGIMAHRIVEGKQGWTQPILNFYRNHFGTEEARNNPKAPLGHADKRRFLYFVGASVSFIGSMLMASVNNFSKVHIPLKTPKKLVKPGKNATILAKYLFKIGSYVEKQPLKHWLEKRPAMMFVIGGAGALIGGGIEALLAQGIADKANIYRKNHFAAAHTR